MEPVITEKQMFSTITHFQFFREASVCVFCTVQNVAVFCPSTLLYTRRV